MKTSDFDYHLPPEFIAQTATEPRDRSRLMVLSRDDGSIAHRHFFELVDLLHEGDVLVFNDSRVIPARLIGRKAGSGGRVELLLLRRLGPGLWEVLVRPGRRVKEGTRIESEDLWGEVLERREGALIVLRFSDEAALERVGQVPLPPYIHRPLEDAVLNEEDLCDILGIDKKTLDALRREQRFPHIRLTTRRRVFLATDVLEWLKRQGSGR